MLIVHSRLVCSCFDNDANRCVDLFDGESLYWIGLTWLSNAAHVHVHVHPCPRPNFRGAKPNSGWLQTKCRLNYIFESIRGANVGRGALNVCPAVWTRGRIIPMTVGLSASLPAPKSSCSSWALAPKSTCVTARIHPVLHWRFPNASLCGSGTPCFPPGQVRRPSPSFAPKKQ